MTGPLVSICIPTFNGAPFLALCLDSVLSQSLGNAEVLVVDDQSTDDTWDIICRYRQAHPRLRAYRNQHNLGLVGNWNRCVELAQGRWIKFLFQDDLMEPNCLERMVEAGERTGRPLVACRRDFIFEGVSTEVVDEYEKFTTTISLDAATRGREDLGPEDFCQAALHFGSANFVGEPSSTLIRRDVFEGLGAFRGDIIQLCDLEFWLRVGVNFGMAYVPETLAHFRVHGQSTTSKNSFAKEYLKDVVDPLILAREFALSPAFAPLRATALAQGRDLIQDYYRSLTNALCQERMAQESRTKEEQGARLSALETIQAPQSLPRRARIALSMKLARARGKRVFQRHLGWRFAARH